MRDDTVSKAVKEYDVLSALSAKLTDRIREGYRASRPAVISDLQQVDLINIGDGLTKAFEEVAKRGYGRVVFGDEYDENGGSLGPAVYRVSQANAGFPDRPIRLVSRNSRIGGQVASCSVGDEITFSVPSGERSIVVNGIIDLSGMSNLLKDNPDARQVLFRLGQSHVTDQIHELAAFVRGLVQPHPEEEADEVEAPAAIRIEGAFAEVPVTEPEKELKPVAQDETTASLPSVPKSATASSPVANLPDDSSPPTSEVFAPNVVQEPTVDLFWDIRPGRTVFADDEEASLGTQFFTQTTSEQEEGIRTVRGLQIVHGVAGSGKTSVALGRLKFFANFRSLENLGEHGLEERDFADYDPSGMIGFVLSPSLVSYLKQTAESLDIGSMKIQDFTEFLNAERTMRRVFQGRPFKKSLAAGHSKQKTVAWLRILDVVAARYIADGLDQILSSQLLPPASVGADRVSDSRWSAMVDSHWLSGQLRGRIQGLIRSLRTEPDLRSKVFLLRKLAVEIDRQVRLGERETSDLEVAERRLLREAVESVQLRMLRLLNPQELYVEIFKQTTYRQQMDGLAVQSGIPTTDVIEPIARRLEENFVTDDDTICALCLNALCCDQFEREIKATPYLRSFAERVGVFIDEYQDFSEIQVLLMGYKAKPKYWLVTVAGDASQRLHHAGLAEVQRAFPQIAVRHTSVLLDRNMRQGGALARLSSCFRSLTEAEHPSVAEACEAPLDVYDDPADFARFAVSRITALPQTASVAVICANGEEVNHWFSLMRDDLETGFKNPMISDKSKLTTRFHTHFTTPIEAKGLEFDAVVIPDLSSFDGEDAVGRNSLYVAASRPRHAILMGCRYSKIDSSLVSGLVDDEHLLLREIGDPDGFAEE